MRSIKNGFLHFQTMNARQVEEILKELCALENHLENISRYLESKSNFSTSSGSCSRTTTSSTRSSKGSSKSKAKTPESNDERPLPKNIDEIYPKSMAGVALIKAELLEESERKYLSRRGLNPNAKEFQPTSSSK